MYAQLPMDILERGGRLLHRGHVLGVEARGLERVDLHLELEARVLQPVELLLRHLLPPQRRGRRCIMCTQTENSSAVCVSQVACTKFQKGSTH